MEEEATSCGRQLRQSTLSHKPGRYEESQAYGKACQGSTADNNENDCQTVAHYVAEKGPGQETSFKDFLLDSSGDLNWGSPEPEDFGEPIEWSQITLSGQWILLLALCHYKSFAPVTQVLRMNIVDIIGFVDKYIQYHQATKLWANEISNTSVGVLFQMIKGVGVNADKTNNLKRPQLPTDILWENDRQLAINYLHQVGQPEFVEEVKKWRGYSPTFHTLPIEPEIMAACSVIRDKGMGSLEVKKIKLPQTKKPNQSFPWIGRVQSECQHLAKCLAELQAYLPPLTAHDKFLIPGGSQEMDKD
ncbi:hypothetical protein LY76DRAFT_653532 [Colletotrichum caudatum]|nr:hypothetical protein LY76DRAFT_653532 [Colletotrichum caudatum]